MFAISCSFSDVFGKQIRSDGRVLLRDRNLQTNARVGTWLPRLLSFSLARLHCVSGTYQGFFLFSWWLKYFPKWLKYVFFCFSGSQIFERIFFFLKKSPKFSVGF
jgi:hypothetical protein